MMSPYISAALAALVAGYGGFLAGHWIGFGRGMKEVPEKKARPDLYNLHLDTTLSGDPRVKVLVDGEYREIVREIRP